MKQKITYFSGIPSAPNTKTEQLTKEEAEQKFGIKWRDFNEEAKVVFK